MSTSSLPLRQRSVCLCDVTLALRPVFFPRVLEVDSWDDGNITYDVISCLNLLDRCDKPVSMLHAMRRVLRPGTGRVLVALVIPFKPYVEFGK